MSQDTQMFNLLAELGTCNVYDMTSEENKNRVIAALDFCTELLQRHAGPYSKYSMSIKLSEGSVAKFTRDGISIIKNLQYVAPLEQHIKSILVYIGELVDDAAKDSTTTAMILAAQFLKSLLKSGMDVYDTPGGIIRKYKADVDAFMKYLQTTEGSTLEQWTKILIDSGLSAEAAEYKAAGKIAYAQAMSSSGGNVELARAMETIFSTCPKVCREYTSFYGTDRETDEEFIVDKLDYDFSLDCSIAHNSAKVFNAALGTEYKRDGVTVIISEEQLIDGTMCTENVRVYLRDHPDETVVVIAPMYSPDLVKYGASTLGKHTFWQHVSTYRSGGDNYMGDLMLAKLLSKGELADEEDIKIVKDVTVHYRNGAMFLTNFYPEADEHAVLHPYYKVFEKVENGELSIDDCDINQRLYIKVIREVLAGLDLYRNQRLVNTDRETLFIKALERMAAYRRTILRIGGATHSTIANQDVAKDVIGAIMTSLRDGFNSGGLVNLLMATEAIQPLANKHLASLAYAIVETANGIYNTNGIKTNINPDLKYYDVVDDINDAYAQGDIPCNILTEESSLTDYREFVLGDYDKWPVLQPLKGVEYMLKCVIDLCLKVALSTEMTVQNSFMLSNKKDKKDE